jgi:aromatic-L-amino-acid decarboxylase
MVLRYFGAEGVRERLRYHIDLAQQFAGWVDADPDFERLAPAPFSVVCFRAKPAGRERTEEELARLNEAILKRVNDSGEIFISHTVLRGCFTLRVAIGNLQTTDRHARRSRWDRTRPDRRSWRAALQGQRATDGGRSFAVIIPGRMTAWFRSGRTAHGC